MQRFLHRTVLVLMVDLLLEECFQALWRDTDDTGTWGDSAHINAVTLGTNLTSGRSPGKLSSLLSHVLSQSKKLTGLLYFFALTPADVGSRMRPCRRNVFMSFAQGDMFEQACGVSSVGITLATVQGPCYVISRELSKASSEEFPWDLSITRQPWANNTGMGRCCSSDSRIAYPQLKTGRKAAKHLTANPQDSNLHRGALVSREDSKVAWLADWRSCPLYWSEHIG